MLRLSRAQCRVVHGLRAGVAGNGACRIPNVARHFSLLSPLRDLRLLARLTPESILPRQLVKFKSGLTDEAPSGP